MIDHQIIMVRLGHGSEMEMHTVVALAIRRGETPFALADPTQTAERYLSSDSAFSHLTGRTGQPGCPIMEAGTRHGS